MFHEIKGLLARSFEASVRAMEYEKEQLLMDKRSY